MSQTRKRVQRTLTMEQGERLRSAAALIESVALELNDKTTPCTCCGLEKAEKWDEKKAAFELRSVIRKLADWSPAMTREEA